MGGGVGVVVGVGAGVGVLCLPVETPPQLMSNMADATAERRGMNLKRINTGAQCLRSDAQPTADVGPRDLIRFGGVGVAHCLALALGWLAVFLVCPGTQHRQLLGVGDEPHVFKHLARKNPIAG